MKNIIIVGCGFSGSILAREIAEKLDLPVRIIERRNHIAGNMYDYRDERGFLLQKYGPHHFYTSNYSLFRYLERFAEFFPHYCKSMNYMNGRYITRPFNFLTVQELMGREKAEPILRKLRNEFGTHEGRVPIYKLIDSKDEDVAKYGNLLFDMAFRPYIAKMWNTPIDKIDKYVLGRRGIAIGYDERDADYDFQGLPKEGFTKMFENMLNHKNITIELNVDANEHISFTDNRVLYDGRTVDCLIFTGAIDELFHFKYGKLPYRSLDIRWEYYNEDSVLPVEGVSYPDTPGFVRKTEYRKMMYDVSKLTGSVLSVEYPLTYDRDSDAGNEPYYPEMNDESQKIYRQYVEESRRYGNIFLCGRLAEFRYIDMHTCVEHALAYFDNVKEYLENHDS
jgi:UDP-galactopyranose mutase